MEHLSRPAWPPPPSTSACATRSDHFVSRARSRNSPVPDEEHYERFLDNQEHRVRDGTVCPRGLRGGRDAAVSDTIGDTRRGPRPPPGGLRLRLSAGG